MYSLNCNKNTVACSPSSIAPISLRNGYEINTSYLKDTQLVMIIFQGLNLPCPPSCSWLVVSVSVVSVSDNVSIEEKERKMFIYKL